MTEINTREMFCWRDRKKGCWMCPDWSSGQQKASETEDEVFIYDRDENGKVCNLRLVERDETNTIKGIKGGRIKRKIP